MGFALPVLAKQHSRLPQNCAGASSVAAFGEPCRGALKNPEKWIGIAAGRTSRFVAALHNQSTVFLAERLGSYPRLDPTDD